MKLVYEKINKDIYKIPINSIKKLNYNKEVYDLSVEKDSPNFITKGNLLVHNSTRANILETLYNRNYVHGQSIEATEIGIKLIQTLRKYSPIIVDEELTREFEKDLEEIEAKTSKKEMHSKSDKILEGAKKAITKISDDMKAHDKQIGKELMEANAEAIEEMKKENEIGMKCPQCKTGGLIINYAKKSMRYFIACDTYPKCEFTLPLPHGKIQKTEKVCDKCKWPLLIRLASGKRPWIFCFNPDCESRKELEAKFKKLDRKKSNKKSE